MKLTLERIGQFQPTLPSRGVTDVRQANIDAFEISTHTPLAGSDSSAESSAFRTDGFQPTLPSRGVTACMLLIFRRCTYFNPHSPRGE